MRNGGTWRDVVVEQLAEVLVVEPLDGLDLDAESVEDLARPLARLERDLERNLPVEPVVPRPEDLAHAAAADPPEDVIPDRAVELGRPERRRRAGTAAGTPGRRSSPRAAGPRPRDNGRIGDSDSTRGTASRGNLGEGCGAGAPDAVCSSSRRFSEKGPGTCNAGTGKRGRRDSGEGRHATGRQEGPGHGQRPRDRPGDRRPVRPRGRRRRHQRHRHRRHRRRRRSPRSRRPAGAAY